MNALAASIVVPAYNETKRLASALQAIQSSVRFSGKCIEILVVDNASNDNTHTIAENLGVRVVSEPRRGVSYARQTGVNNANAEIILTTDADTIVPLTWVSSHLRWYTDAKVVGVGGSYVFTETHLLFSYYIAGAVLVQTLYEWCTGKKVNRWRGCNLSYRKLALLAVGGYAPGVNVGDDCLIGEKLSRRGTMIYDPSIENTVRTSGRRFATAAQVAQLCMGNLYKLCTGRLYHIEEVAQDFPSIR